MSKNLLLQPYEFKNWVFLNRIAMAPLTRARAGESRIPNALMAEYYAQRASAGLIIAEATSVSEQGLGWINSPGIYTTEQAEGWKLITQAVHEKGGKIILQLWHCGRASHTSFHPEQGLPVSASAIAIKGDQIHTPIGKVDYETPRALETQEIADVVQDYLKAAQLAKEAGFDGVEVHSANGYLLNQFLDDSTNHRDDQYGGSLENRARFLMEVVDAVCSVWPKEQVGVRISPNGVFNDMGPSDHRSIFTFVAEELNKKQIGYLHIMDGLAFGFHGKGEPMTLSDFRSVFTNTIIANCGYDQQSGEKALENNLCDLVCYGRPYITNPDLVERFKNNWPLTPFDDMSLWYGGGAEGYTSYSSYQPEFANV